MKPIKISFFLKKSAKTEKKPIILKGNFGYKRYDPIKKKTNYESLVFYTGESVSIKEWDIDNALPFDPRIIARLQQLKENVDLSYRTLINQKIEVSPEILKLQIEGKKTIEMNNSSIRIVSFIEQHIESNTKLSAGRIKHYKKLRLKLEEFEKVKGFYLTTDKLNEDYYLEFIDFWKVSLNKANSVWSIHKDLKGALNKIRKKYKVDFYNPIDLSDEYKPKQAEAPRPFLTLSEAHQILNYSPTSDKLKNVQFILATLIYSGCRYSDVYKVIPENKYEKNGVIFNYAHFITQKKPQTEVIVPILKPLQRFYDLNNGNPPRKISDVKFNKYVKELICEMRDDPKVKFDKEFKLAFTDKDNKKVFETVRLSEKISSHIGRISFITSLIHLMPITVLTKITAHKLKDSSVIFSYNKISLIDNAVLFVEELKRIQDNGKLKVELV